ncbi:MAG TPA: hypothetical protein VMD99_02005 [Terriglobales bacterium]|jgi:hypothetical protein|nr:hypothetical protein [Terriglobales bacterium]
MPPISHAQLATTQISVINESTVLTDAEVIPVVAALQQQVTNDFRPVWGTDAELKMIPQGAQPLNGSWWLVILDDSDQAGALGYHDLTPDGLPMGKVFAASDLKSGTSWSVTASHELLEMLADPNINLTVFVQNANAAGMLYAYEVCDACEDDSFGYPMNNILVSDFVYPAWFESFRLQGSTQFDRCNVIQSPLELVAGGYIGVFNVTDGSGWQQHTAEKHPTNLRHRGHVGSRRERRSVPHNLWLTSLPQRKITNNSQQYRQHLQTILRKKPAA